jgi:LPXTG-motif cell wall-anchored protein
MPRKKKKGNTYLLIAGGVLVLGIGAYIFMKRRQKKKMDLLYEVPSKSSPSGSGGGGSSYSGRGFPLKKGSGGNKVVALQKYLNESGSYGLDVDGKFGNKTKGALEQEQSPFENLKVSYPSEVFGQVSEEYYNDNVKQYE